MQLHVSNLKKSCIEVLRNHIGLAADLITHETIERYLKDTASTKEANGYKATFIPWLFFSILSKKLPASLPLQDIELAIFSAYSSTKDRAP